MSTAARYPPTRNLLDYALYVAFFPQLVAGPIERASHMLPQFRRERGWSGPAFESGLQLMVWGLFKKVVIADTLAPYVNAVYADPAECLGCGTLHRDRVLCVSNLLRFLRILRHRARCCAHARIRLDKEFRLSVFFEDSCRVLAPLAYQLVPVVSGLFVLSAGDALHAPGRGWASRYKAHIVAMTLIGFWHGANWTFVVFGFYWGIVIAFYLYGAERSARLQPAAVPSRWKEAWNRIRTTMSVPLMFVVVCVGWILFRAESLAEALVVLTGFFRPTGNAVLPRPELAALPVLWALVGGLWLAESAARRWPALEATISAAALPRMAARYAMPRRHSVRVYRDAGRSRRAVHIFPVLKHVSARSRDPFDTGTGYVGPAALQTGDIAFGKA